MKISLNWINELLEKPIDIDPFVLSDMISVTLAEVESVSVIGKEYKDIIVAEILTINKHPNADKLKLVEIDYGKEKTVVVCGANNLKVGQKVPFIAAGGVLPDGRKIDKTEIRGILSDGMLCSQKELSFGDDHSGILILSDINYINPQTLTNGNSLAKVLNLDDVIIEIENKALTHRPDCFSHIGIAREIATLTGNNLTTNKDHFSVIPTSRETINIENKAPDLCPRYSMIVIKDIVIKESPLWLRYRLSSIGQRPINNIVDATNYIMWLTGQPIHAFDYDKIPSNKIIIRRAKLGETITTLDGIDRDLNAETLVIADENEPIAIAGVMGGASSEITDKTTCIAIESANFDMSNIRTTSSKIGLRTDASTIFEKGQDPNKTLDTLEKVSDLIIDIASGDIASDIIDLYESPLTPKEMTFRNALIRRKLGFDIEKNRVVDILEHLGIEIINKNELPADNDFTNYSTQILIPTYRRDLNIEEDILEELARFYGYENVKPKLPNRDLSAPKQNKTRNFIKTITERLAILGMNEVYTYGFVSGDLYEKCLLNKEEAIKIINPISEEYELMRTSLIPSLISKCSDNQKNFDQFALFEISRVYLKGKFDKIDPGIPAQPYKISGLMYGENNSYKAIKCILDDLFVYLGLDIKFSRIDKQESSKYPNYLIKTQSASINLRSDPKDLIGFIGNVSFDVLDKFEIDKQISVFELDLDTMIIGSSENIQYKPIPKFQPTRRDLSFTVNKEAEIGEIIFELKKNKDDIISNIELIDIFEDDKRLGDEKQSITLRVEIQSKYQTLTDTEINGALLEITNFMSSKYKALQRT